VDRVRGGAPGRSRLPLAIRAHRHLARGTRCALIGARFLCGCSSSTSSPTCFPDSDGIIGGAYVFDLTVDDTGFSKTVLTTQNDAQVTLTLQNTGTKPHGFQVDCTGVTLSYPTVPPGCPTIACFPSNSLIPPLAPGASATITFDTPVPDGLIYPFRSSEPDDAAVPGLHDGQWVVM
jgi:hypothetical protein